MAKKDPLTPWANLVGKGLAHVQDITDRVIDYGFAQMKQMGEHQEKMVNPKEGKYVKGAKAVGKGFLRFLGKAGDAYYRKYEELKKK